MPQPPGYPVSLDGVADRLTHDEPDSRTVGVIVVAMSVDHQVRLTSPNPAGHGGAELSGARHPVSSRQHGESRRSGSQRTTALTAPAGNDGPPCAGPHPQPEAMDPGPAPVVRLEGALALGHGSRLLINVRSIPTR